MDQMTANEHIRGDKPRNDNVTHTHARGRLPQAYPGAYVRSQVPGRGYRRPRHRLVTQPQADPPVAAAIICTLCAPFAILVILCLMARTLSGAVLVTVVAAVSIAALGVLTRLAHMSWGDVCFVATLHVVALIASLLVTAADVATSACWYVMGCLIAFQPMGFGIGIYYGMTSKAREARGR